MSRRHSARLGTLLAAVGLLLWGMPTASAQESAASSQLEYVYYNGEIVGSVTWNQDPAGSTPGDSMMVCDLKSDGWAIEADLFRTGVVERTVNTRGHNAVYCSPWASGNLQENLGWVIHVNMVNGSNTRHIHTMYVNS
ncbi:hypothetical protein [Streptomyces sp. NPDC059076]|uniref:hypothetical protein n=1 Tax=unclassified Streptomyces TaxID=2593676 RepID=UPI0036B56F2A